MLRLLAPALALSMLAGVGLDRASREEVPAAAIDYHADVREGVSAIPYRVGDWVGVDTEIRQDALRILDANASLSRSYRHVSTGRTATLLLVHCDDSRSLLGHYPPVCYPSQGWTQVSASPREIAGSGVSFHTTEYMFEYENLNESARLGVLHFTVLPDGRTAPDMDLLDEAARDKRIRSFGGASLQIVIDGNLPESERSEIYEAMIQAATVWVKEVGTGLSS